MTEIIEVSRAGYGAMFYAIGLLCGLILGRILIHVSKKLLTGYKDLMIHLMRNGTLKIDTITLSEELKKIESECGMIIGSVELYDCIKGYESKWAEDGMYHE